MTNAWQKAKRFIGPKWYRMNGQRGFGLGLLVGFLAWIGVGRSTVSLDRELPSLRIFLAILGVLLVILQYARGKATLKPAGDGFIYGLALAFDLLGWLSTGSITV